MKTGKRVPSSSLKLFFALPLLLALLLPGLPARAEMQDYQAVKLRSLDKVTARTKTFEAKVGSTIKFGPLYIKIQSCRKAPPIDQPESAAFLQIWEMTPEDKAQWVFSGWMFASSPALSAMDHPIYDVWVLDCLGAPPEEELPAPEGGLKTTSGQEMAPAQPQPKEATTEETEDIESDAGD